MRTRHSIYAVSVLLAAIISSCSGRQGTQVIPGKRVFPALHIPSLYSGTEERLQYAAGHFWDSFLSEGGFLCDSMTVNGVEAEEFEEQFSTYVTLLKGLGLGEARKDVGQLFGKVEAFQKADTLSNVYASFAHFMYKYLYDPNSPYRCEDIYYPYVRGLATSDVTDPDMVPAYSSEARMCSLNVIGTKATDFRFVDVKGRQHTLYGVKADHTLLFFSNPGCENCKEIIGTLRSSPLADRLISSGSLAVVNVYIDEDIQAWKDYQDHYPSSWYNGYDPSYSIRQDLTYCVRAIPSLYMLGPDKEVILKDAPENEIFAFLESLSGY